MCRGPGTACHNKMIQCIRPLNIGINPGSYICYLNHIISSCLIFYSMVSRKQWPHGSIWILYFQQIHKLLTNTSSNAICSQRSFLRPKHLQESVHTEKYYQKNHHSNHEYGTRNWPGAHMTNRGLTRKKMLKIKPQNVSHPCVWRFCGPMEPKYLRMQMIYTSD